MAASPELLQVSDLSVTYTGGARAVRGVSFALAPGECLALVGESGCGKTTVARAILGLLPRGTTVDGSILLAGQELVGADERALREVRGQAIGLVWQDPFDAANPLLSVGSNVAEAWRAHATRPPATAVERALAKLGIAGAPQRARQYPHEWSGGMLQRAAIAAASALSPSLVVADEPTSALDADRAAATLRALRAGGAAILLVSHDLALVAAHADRVAVCYAGRIVEIGPAVQVAGAPRHPYSLALNLARPQGKQRLPPTIGGSPPAPTDEISGCAFMPRCPVATPSCRNTEPALRDGVACQVGASQPARATLPENAGREELHTAGEVLLVARSLRKIYGHRRNTAAAVDGVTLAIRRREMVGISGPSGCGKSTLLRLLAGLEPPSSGELSPGTGPDGAPIASRSTGFGAPCRTMAIFQDASGSLNPRWPVWRSIAEPLRWTGTPAERRDAKGLLQAGRWPGTSEARRLATQGLAEVGLGHVDPDALPGELSVGQCQRVAIARALLAKPQLLAADESTSALDGPLSASIMALLVRMASKGTAVVLASHDRPLLEAVCHRVLDMRNGTLAE